MAAPADAQRQGSRIFLVVLFLLAGLIGLYLWQTGTLPTLAQRLAPQPALPSSNAPLQAFFTTPTLAYPDNPARRPAVPLLEQLLRDIGSARSNIDLASFDFDLGELTNALLLAQRRGVTVRLVIDSENLVAPEASLQAGRLEQAGISVQFDRREPFMHNKFAVIDGQVTWLGSWNMTANDTWRNNNNMVRVRSPQLAADYRAEFEQMLAGRFGTAKTSATPYRQVQVGAARAEVYFAPEDGVAAYVLQQLQAAKRTISFMAFSFTSASIADALVAQHQAGLRIHGVMEAQNAQGSGAMYHRLYDSGVDVLTDGNCYIMHHKVFIIDEHLVITGSYNFTSSAEVSNDENLVIIDDATLAHVYLDEFARVYSQAQIPARCR